MQKVIKPTDVCFVSFGDQYSFDVVFPDGRKKMDLPLAELPSPKSISDYDQVHAEVIKAGKKIKPDHRNKWRFEAVLAGKSFAEPNDKDNSMQAVVSTWVFSLPRHIDEEKAIDSLIEIFTPSLTVWTEEDGATKSIEEELEKLVQKATAAFSDRATKDAQKAERLSKDAEIVRAGLRINGKEPTKEEISNVEQYSLIQCGKVFYAYSSGWEENPTAIGYIGPFLKDDLVAQLERLWSQTDKSLTYVNDKGEEKEKTISRLMREYGTAALEVIGNTFEQNSHFDPSTATFHRAMCSMRVLEAVYDPDIARWLHELGGDNREKLLDWLAAVPQLNRQLCALYLEGVMAIGKNLLGDGISRLWRTTGPSDFLRILDGFNADLFSNPFCRLDEGMPANVQHTSALIRSMLGSSEHSSNQKFMPAVKVLGNVRLMITANNDTVLQQLAKEDMGEADIEAFVSRILHIHGQPSAADIIKELNAKDRAIVDSWTHEDKLAKHVRWLMENRVITPGQRFLVEGEPTAMHRALITRGNARGSVLEWLVRFMMDPSKIKPEQKKLFRFGNGDLFINTQVVMDNFEFYCPNTQRLTLTSIGRILGQISTKYRANDSGDRVRFHKISTDVVFDWAAGDAQIGDVAVMRKNLMRVL